ncbi:hypothetical protein [Faecalicoccus pleomorphus]|uniref:hypothetical protein n=1 Tax=Faecalicoccus pleomorphus TaxID=1323 RepID=UPI0022E053EF|nr:hypothetical protein [Faecalicoccus pleomorphus]
MQKVQEIHLGLFLCIIADGSRSPFNLAIHLTFIYVHAIRYIGDVMRYDTKRWKEKRKHILKLDGYLCQVSKWYGVRKSATIVHHIYPADEYPEYQYCDWNLISVSDDGHNKLENRTTGELTELGKSLQARTVPGIDWRKKKNEYAI